MSGTTGRRLGGIATMSIGGDPWDVAGDLAWSPVNVLRETVKGQSRVEGYNEMPAAVFISAKLRDRPDVAVSSLNGLGNVPITVVQANGKTVSGDGMWQTGEIEVNTQEATFSIRFEGDFLVEGVT